jgi:hypothetical protein
MRSPTDLAEAYFAAWSARRPDDVRPLLADDVTFRGPLGTADGPDACVAGLAGMFGATDDVRVVRRWVDGDDVLTWFQLEMNGSGPMAVVNWSHVRAGAIDRIRVTFDPRPLFGG